MKSLPIWIHRFGNVPQKFNRGPLESSLRSLKRAQRAAMFHSSEPAVGKWLHEGFHGEPAVVASRETRSFGVSAWEGGASWAVGALRPENKLAGRG